MNYLKDDLKDKLLDKAGEVNLDSPHYASFERIEKYNGIRIFAYWLIGFFVLLIGGMFLPWTQNVQTKGKLTTQLPEDRPQKIHTQISGKIKRWWVIEGEHVYAGDTLVQITEVKDKYRDPALIERTEAQLKAKESSIGSYTSKVAALNQLINAVKAEQLLKQNQLDNKIRQSQLKVISDSNAVIAAQTDAKIAATRLKRTEQLYKDGIKSLTDLESKRIKFQQANAKLVSAENKLVIGRAALTNAIIERNNILNSYLSKISKAQSDLFSAESNLFTAQAEVSKLKNTLSNYRIRDGLYFVVAPRDGYIVKTHYPGSGEIVKEGSPLVTLMPNKINLAAELYVRPVDLPLIKLGERIRVTFDGWPVLVVSGWPATTIGTFGGEVYAIDRVISPNGKYRVLVIPDPNDEPWPELLKVGSGAQGIFLLNDVPVYYELWRQINGFPPDYYSSEKGHVPLDYDINEKDKYHTK